MARIAPALGLLGAYLAGQGASLALTGAGTGTGGSERSRRTFASLPTPSWAPPSWTYGVVWSGLAVTSSAAGWRVWTASGGAAAEGPARTALALWAAAIVPRSAYTPLAFRARRQWAATADSAALAATWAGFALAARRVDRTAFALALPELAWTSFATVLSAATARRS